jgi:BioD-like phosphotransacetylase family protein
MPQKSLYIAASGQHVGKSTITLGLCAALERRGVDVGYSKPLGQKYVVVDGLRVDKDAALLSRAMRFSLETELHSPVIIGSGDTVRYLDGEGDTAELRDRILSAASILRRRHDVVIFEGAGHPGVGSVVDLSGAQIARMLGASVVLVVEGGIGSTIDQIALCQSMFTAAGVPIRGVIANKVMGHKLDKVRQYLTQALAQRGLELLGAVPSDLGLRYPSVRYIAQMIAGEVVAGAAHVDTLARDAIASTWFDFEVGDRDAGLLLVTCAGRLSAVLSEARARQGQAGRGTALAGIAVAGEGCPTMEQCRQADSLEVPLVRTRLGMDQVLGRVGKLVAKMHERSDHDIQRAIELCEAHVDMERVCELLTAEPRQLRGLQRRHDRRSVALHARHEQWLGP